MNPKAWEKLCDNFETRDLLDAVGSIDEARGYLNDTDIARPPQLRIDLLELHGVAMRVVNEGEKREARAMFDAAFEIREQVTDVIEYLEQVEKALDHLLRFDSDMLDGPGDDEDDDLDEEEDSYDDDSDDAALS